MAKTRRPIVKGLLTKDRLGELRPGMVLRIHIPNADGLHWDWYDVRYVKHYGLELHAADTLDDLVGTRQDMHVVGILPYLSGRFSNAFTCIRDEEVLR